MSTPQAMALSAPTPGATVTNQSVASDLEGLGVQVPRFTIMGYGEAQPVADNETAEGKAENRRVELRILGSQ